MFMKREGKREREREGRRGEGERKKGVLLI